MHDSRLIPGAKLIPAVAFSCGLPLTICMVLKKGVRNFPLHPFIRTFLIKVTYYATYFAMMSNFCNTLVLLIKSNVAPAENAAITISSIKYSVSPCGTDTIL